MALMLKRLFRILRFVVLVALAFVVGAVAVLTLTGKGRENLAGLISDFASTPDLKIRLAGLNGIWSGHLTLDQIVIEDSTGPWLAVRGAAVDWSPTSLLWGRFEAQRIAAARVEVARPPVPSKAPPSKGGSGGLPVDIAIGALDFPDIALGEDVTGGRVASITANGKANVQSSPLTVVADLDVSRTDGTAGGIAGAVTFAPADNKLDVDLKASEPAGGILANLLGLPGQPAVDIIVSGSGPIANWRGTATFSVDGNLVTTASATHRLTEAGRIVEAKGDGEFMRFLPERLRPLLAGRTDFDLAGTLTPSGGIEIARANIDSGALAAQASGSFDPAGATDLAVELTTKNGGVALGFGTAESPIDIVLGSASIRALGDGREPGLDITANLPSVATRDVRLSDLAIALQSDGFDITKRSGPVTGSATAAALVIDNPTVAPLVAGQIRAGLKGTLAPDTLTISQGTLASDAIDGSFAGDVSLADGSITLKLDANVLSAALPAGARPLLGETVVLAAAIARDSSGNVSADDVSLASGGLTANASAALRNGSIDAELNGALADIAPLAAQASGGVALSATAKGSLLTPDLTVTVNSDRLAFGESAIDDLKLSASGKADAAAPQASVTLTGSFQGEAIDGKAVVATADGKSTVRDLTLAFGPNRIAGALDLDERFLPSGRLDLDLPELGRLAALAGQTIEGAAKGSATFTSDGATPQVKLALTSDSIKRDALDVTAIAIDAAVADYIKDPAISGTVGATVAGLVPDQPPAAISLSLEGTPAAINGNGTLAIGGGTISTFTLAHRQSEVGSVVEAKGDATLARFAPERLRRLVDGTTVFDLAATLGKGPISIDRAEVSNGALTARASGTYDPAGPVDLSLQLGAGTSGVPMAFGTEEAPIDITLDAATIRATGDAKEPTLDIVANLPKIFTQHVGLQDAGLTLHAEKFNLATRSGAVTGTARAAKLIIDNPAVAPLVAGEIRAELNGALTTDALRVDSGILRSDAVDGGFGGLVSLADGTIKLDLRADVASSALPDAARPLLGEKLSLSTSLARDSQGNVSANSLALKSGGLSGGGVVRISGDQIDADVKGALADIAPLAEQARGAIAFAATAKGALSAPDVALSVTSDKMTVAARDIENLNLTASGRADMANPQASVTLKGTVAGEALDGKAVLSTADGRRAVRDLSLSLGRNRIAGALALDENFVPDGTVEFDLPDIGPLAALALEEIEGSIKGSAAFTRQGEAAQAKISATSAAITRGDLSIRSVAVNADITDYMRAPGVAGTVKAQEVRSGTTAIRGVDFTLSREAEWTRFSGGATVNDIPLKAVGRVKSAGGATTVELASAEATMRGIRAALARPTTVKIAGGQTTLDNLALAVGGGSAVVSGTAGSALNLNVTLSRLPASLANAFAPGLDAGGAISGTVKVSGAAANPTVGYTLDWGGAETAQTRAAGVDALAIRSSGTFASNQLKFDADVGGGGLAIKGGGTVAVATPPRLDLKFDGTVPFSLLADRLAAQGLSLTGTANASVAVSGAATAPVISGSVRTSGARFIHAGSGIAINDLAADIGLGGGRATINRLTGSISSGGTVSASGSVGIDASQGLPADITIRLTNARYSDGEVVTTTASGNLAVRGPLMSAPVVSGNIDLARTVITVPERLPGSLTALDVRHKNAPPAVIRQDKAMRPAGSGNSGGGGGGGGLALDLTINAPQRIFVQGRGLDAELGGSLKLVGPAAAPQATGQFTLRRGRLSLLGRRLTFTRGTLSFAGSLVPYLDFAAESAANDATVTVLVSGPANNPKFSFSSVPSLPEDEVLARLIFGRAMSNLSPLQIAQLADAAATLAGGGGTTSLLSTLRERLGVDDLDVKTNEQGDTTVSVGKYLNDRTYVTIEKGDKAGSGRAAVDLDVGRGLKLRGEARDDGEARGGIFYEREY